MKNVVRFCVVALLAGCTGNPEADSVNDRRDDPASGDAGRPEFNRCADDDDCSAGERCNDARRCVVPCHRDVDCNNPALWCGFPFIMNDHSLGTCQFIPEGYDAGRVMMPDASTVLPDAGHTVSDAGMDAGVRTADSGSPAVHSLCTKSKVYLGGSAEAPIQLFGALNGVGVASFEFRFSTDDIAEQGRVFKVRLRQNGSIAWNEYSNVRIYDERNVQISRTLMPNQSGVLEFTLEENRIGNCGTLRIFVWMDIGPNAPPGRTINFVLDGPSSITAMSRKDGSEIPACLENAADTWPLGDNDVESNFGITAVASTPDAGQPNVDAGTVNPDPRCVNPDPSRYADTHAYVWLDEPAAYEYAEGRVNAKVLTGTLIACEDLDVMNLQLYIDDFTEYQQNPQSPDDPTGILLNNGVMAFNNYTLWSSGVLMSATPVLFRATDSSMGVRFDFNTYTHLTRGHGLPFEITVNILENPGLSNTTQRFHVTSGGGVRTQSGECAASGCGAATFRGSQFEHELVVSYGNQQVEATMLRVQLNAMSRRDPVASGSDLVELATVDIISIGPDRPEIQEIGYVIVNAGGWGLGLGAHALRGAFTVVGPAYNIHTHAANNPDLYGTNGLTVANDTITTMAANGQPTQHVLDGYPYLFANSTFTMHFLGNISPSATSADAYMVRVTSVKWRNTTTNTFITQTFSVDGNPIHVN